MISPKIVMTATALAAVFLFVLSGVCRAHDDYTDWKQPGSNISCCSDKDCYPTEAKFQGGNWYALRRENKQWVRIPPDKIINVPNPDGRAHLCMSDNFIWCFLPPVGDT